MTIPLTVVLDIALTHTADFESAFTALAKAAATEPVCSATDSGATRPTRAAT